MVTNPPTPTNRLSSLSSMIARAASIQERINCDAFTIAENKAVSKEELTKEWRSVLGATSPENVSTFLKLMNWTEEEFFAAIQGKVRLTNLDKLPPWALHLREIFAELPEYCKLADEELKGKDTNNVEAICLPFVKMAAQFIIRESDRLQLGITYESGKKMVLVFSQRLITLCAAVVDAEIYLNSVASVFSGGAGRPVGTLEGWRARLDRYPVLGRLIAVSWSNWKAMILEFMQRLKIDEKHIADVFFNGAPLGLLVGFSGDEGDVHCGGRSVIILTFEGGRKLVYKPKDLSIANTYFALVKQLNPSLSLPLHTRRVSVRGEYTWEEFIENKACQSSEEFPAFFRRLGMQLRLFQLLGARDFWLDNLIAHGNDPVFIDLEMVIQNGKEEGEALLASEQIMLAEMEETISKIGVIAMPTPIGVGVKAEDLGALAKVRQFSSPFKMEFSSENTMGLNIKSSSEGFISWSKKDYLPQYQGVYAEPSVHMDQLLAGYEEMNRVLIEQKVQLLQGGVIDRFENALLRYIHRDTWTYMRIINNSVHSQSLIDGIAREKNLYSLFSEVWKEEGMDRFQALALADEIRAMMELDVPLFNAKGGSRDLVVEGRQLENYFSHCALEKIKERLTSIAHFDLQHHCAIIKSNFFCGDHPPPLTAHQAFVAQRPPAKSWQDYAHTCAQLMIQHSVRGSEGDCAWSGLAYHPHIDTYIVEVLKPDILSGTCGFSMLFTDLFRAYGEPTYRAYAEGSLASTLAVVEQAATNFRHLSDRFAFSEKPLFLGAYYGIGSQILALAHTAKHLSSTKLQQALEHYVNILPLKTIQNHASRDFVSGYPGLLFSLIDFKNDQEISQWAQATFKGKKAFPEQSYLLTGLPSIEPGSAYLQQILHKEKRTNFSFNQEIKSADLFTALEFLNADEEASIPSPFHQYLAASPDQLSTIELIEHADLALTLYDQFRQEKYQQQAAQFAQAIIQRYEQTGEWFSDLWAADRHHLSVINGIGALCHLFLRLGHPGQFGSFRQLSSFKNHQQ